MHRFHVDTQVDMQTFSKTRVTRGLKDIHATYIPLNHQDMRTSWPAAVSQHSYLLTQRLKPMK